MEKFRIIISVYIYVANIYKSLKYWLMHGCLFPRKHGREGIRILKNMGEECKEAHEKRFSKIAQKSLIKSFFVLIYHLSDRFLINAWLSNA